MRKKIITMTGLIVLMILSISITSQAYKKRTYARTASISAEDYGKILDTLRSHEPAMGAPGEALLYDTGIRPKDEDEACRMINSFSAAYLGDKDFVIIYDEGGYDRPTVKTAASTDDGTETKVTFGGIGGKPSIYAGWLPDSDPEKSLKEHDGAWEALSAAAKAAPSGRKARHEYFRDYLCRMLSPETGGKNNGAAILSCRGQSAAYASCFYALCMMCGDDCLYVPVTGAAGSGRYFRNAVEENGKYYWIDTYMADKDGGKGYFYVPVSGQFTEVFEGPYIIR